MMAALRAWLMGVIAVSILWAAADSLMPAGGVKRVGQLGCGLVLLFVVIEPLAALQGRDLAGWMARYCQNLYQEEEHLEQQTALTRKEVIEEHCEAYISDKAAELGIPCQVEVECQSQEEGLYLPQSVCLWGDFTDEIQSRLTQLLESQLGIPSDRQTYYLAKEEAS